MLLIPGLAYADSVSKNPRIGGIVTSGTDGSILFLSGTPAKLSQDNSNFFINDATNLLLLGGTSAAAANTILDATGSTIFNEQGADKDFRIESDTDANMFFVDASANRVGFGTASPSTKVHILNDVADASAFLITAATSQTAPIADMKNSSSTSYFTIGPPTLSGTSQTSNYLNITGTFPSTLTTTIIGALLDFTTAGSSGQAVYGMQVLLRAGYTGSFSTAAMNFSNTTAGTAGSLTGADGNVGALGTSSATTTGWNFGHFGAGSGGTVSAGIGGRATTAKASATNIGVAGVARNTGSSGVQIGGWFGTRSTDPSFVSGALVCDNGAETTDIFVARDNGGTIFTIADAIGTATTVRFKEAQGADVGSANDLTLGNDGNTFEITGTTQINAITTTNWQNGSLVTLLFASTPTVKHNTAGGAGTAVILLSGAADFAATGGDTLTLRLSEIGGTQAWREIGRVVI